MTDREIDRLVSGMDDSLDKFIKMVNDGTISSFDIKFNSNDKPEISELVSYTGRGEDADD